MIVTFYYCHDCFSCALNLSQLLNAEILGNRQLFLEFGGWHIFLPEINAGVVQGS